MKEKLIELAKKIKDEKLRSKTIELIKDPKLTNPFFSHHERESIENVRTPFSVNNVIVYRELVKHTTAVVEMCIQLADIIEKNYGITINRDYLIAGALLHDIMKVYEWKEGQRTDILIDHADLIALELYKRDFPEEVIHIVISHPGDSSSPPRTVEALILHYVDTLAALIESFWPQA